MDPTVEQAHHVNADKSILVQVHPSSSGDIFYNSRMGNRQNYYLGLFQIFGYPFLIVDGLGEPPFPYSTGNITSSIDNRRAIDTPISIFLEGSKSSGKISNTFDTKGYSATITAENAINSADLRFLLFVVETNINYSASNGTTVHNDVAIDILPDENGTKIDFANGQPLSIDIDGSFDISNVGNTENLSIVGIVQDFNTGEVYQAAKLEYDQFLATDDFDNSIPNSFEINNLYPNPFNPVVNIPFTIGNESDISLKVLNLLGEEITTIIDNKTFTTGQYNIQWNASGFPAGMYIIKFITEQGTKFKKAILLK